MKTCIACGMPMKTSAEFANGDENKDYCVYCVRPDGFMQSYDEKLESMTGYIVRTQGLDAETARNVAREAMSKLPAWRTTNETIKAILTRRSIRAFETEQIKENELQTILEAGKFAPSAMNQQSWHFTVIQNKEMLHKINLACKSAFEKSDVERFKERARTENFSICYNAPTYIIVSGMENAIAPINDCTLALGNMFLCAESLGIGSCWIHAVNFLFKTQESKILKEELGIPEGYLPFCSGAFGYKSGELPKAAPRREGTVTIIR